MIELAQAIWLEASFQKMREHRPPAGVMPTWLYIWTRGEFLDVVRTIRG